MGAFAFASSALCKQAAGTAHLTSQRLSCARPAQTTFELRRTVPVNSELRLTSYRHSTEQKFDSAFQLLVTDGKTPYSATFTAASTEECESWIADLKSCIMTVADSENSVNGYATHHELVAGTLPHEILHDSKDLLTQLQASGDLLSVAGEQDQFGASAFAVAAFVGASDVLNLMLKVDGAAAAFALPDSRGNTPLCIAAARNHATFISMAARAGLDVNSAGEHLPPWRMRYDGGGGGGQTFPLILFPKMLPGPFPPDANGTPPLQYAVAGSCDGAIEALVEASVQIDAVGTDGLSGLMRACKLGHGSAVRRWIELGADIEIVGADGNRPIHFAASATLPKSVLTPLVETGVRLSAMNAQKQTAGAPRYPPSTCRLVIASTGLPLL